MRDLRHLSTPMLTPQDDCQDKAAKETEESAPSGERVPASTSSGSAGYPDVGGDGDDGAGTDDQWLARLGYASFEEYLRGLEETRQRMFSARRSNNEVRDPHGGWHPALDVAFETDLDRVTGSRRQVGVKLSALDYNDLKLAADRFGVSPTTFARILIIRGVRSTLQSVWEETLD